MKITCNGVQAEIKGSRWTSADKELQEILTEYTDIILMSTDTMLHIPDVSKYITSFIVNRLTDQGVTCVITDQHPDEPEQVIISRSNKFDFDKKYVRRGETPPKWAKLKRGPKGGLHYDDIDRTVSFIEDRNFSPVPETTPHPVYMTDKDGNMISVTYIMSVVKNVVGKEGTLFTMYSLPSDAFNAQYGRGENDSGAFRDGTNLILSDDTRLGPIREEVRVALGQIYQIDSLLKQGILEYITNSVAIMLNVTPGENTELMRDMLDILDIPAKTAISIFLSPYVERDIAGILTDRFKQLFNDGYQIIFDNLVSELESTVPGMACRLDEILKSVQERKPLSVALMVTKVSDDDLNQFTDAYRFKITHADSWKRFTDQIAKIKEDPFEMKVFFEQVQYTQFHISPGIIDSISVHLIDQACTGLLPPNTYMAGVPSYITDVFDTAVIGDVVYPCTWIHTQFSPAAELVISFKADNTKAGILYQDDWSKEYIIDRNVGWKVIDRYENVIFVEPVNPDPVLDLSEYQSDITMDDCNRAVSGDLVSILAVEKEMKFQIPETTLYMVNGIKGLDVYSLKDGDEFVQPDIQICSLAPQNLSLCIVEFVYAGTCACVHDCVILPRNRSYKVINSRVKHMVVDTGTLDVVQMTYLTILPIESPLPVSCNGTVIMEQIPNVIPEKVEPGVILYKGLDGFGYTVLQDLLIGDIITSDEDHLFVYDFALALDQAVPILTIPNGKRVIFRVVLKDGDPFVTGDNAVIFPMNRPMVVRDIHIGTLEQFNSPESVYLYDLEYIDSPVATDYEYVQYLEM